MAKHKGRALKKPSKRKIKAKYLLLLFLLAFLIFPLVQGISKLVKQEMTNKLVEKASYPEIKGKQPTFQIDIQTDHSLTHVISYLPKEFLPVEKFHPHAAKIMIAYVEKIAREKTIYTVDPYLKNGSTVTVKFIPRNEQPTVNYVILISGDDPIPNILKSTSKNFSLLTQYIKKGQTFFWTIELSGGSTSFLRFSESSTWKYGLPTEKGQDFLPLQQLNEGFNIETWKRTLVAIPEPPNMRYKDHDTAIFEAEESLWNAFGQLITAAQEGTSIDLIAHQLNYRPQSFIYYRSYYQFDEKAEKIYFNAPRDPVIR